MLFSNKIRGIQMLNNMISKDFDVIFWVNQKSDLSNLTPNSDNFLPTLARHIYSFRFS